MYSPASDHLSLHVLRVRIRHLSTLVHRAPYAGWPTVEDVRMDLGRLDIFVAQAFLNRSDVIAAFKQMRSDGMPEWVAGRPFR